MVEKVKIEVVVNGEVDHVAEVIHHVEGDHQHIHLSVEAVIPLVLDLDRIHIQDHVLDHNRHNKYISKHQLKLSNHRVEQYCRGLIFFYLSGIKRNRFFFFSHFYLFLI